MDSLCVAALLLALCSPVSAFAPTAISRGNPRSIDHVQLHDQLSHASSATRHSSSSSSSRESSAETERRRGVGDRGRELVLEATAVDRMDRADFVRVAAGAASTLVATSLAKESLAADVSAPEEKYVDFVDSRGLFSCRIPADFLRAERAKDKKGTVFVSGNYNKAEVLSVQSLTAYELLKDAGFPTVGDLTKWEGLGKPRIIAELLKQRRDSDAAGGAQVESVVLPGIVMEGDVLQFTLKSPIKVMRTDLLEKERGVSELYRNTYVKAIMRGDGSFLIVWAGALNTDWDGEGGAKNRLKEAVDSFRLEGLIVDGVRLGAV